MAELLIEGDELVLHLGRGQKVVRVGCAAPGSVRRRLEQR